MNTHILRLLAATLLASFVLLPTVAAAGGCSLHFDPTAPGIRAQS